MVAYIEATIKGTTQIQQSESPQSEFAIYKYTID